MTSAAAAAGILLARSGGALGHRSSLRRVDPASLRPEGRAASLPGDAFGATWTVGGSRLAVVTKPDAGVGFLVHVLRLPDLAPAGTIDVGARDVCGLTFRGATLVALVSSGLCYQGGGSFAILSLDIAGRRVVSTTRVRGLRRVVPASLAFGAGDAFVGVGGGAVAVVDLRTGATSVHTPRRALADGSSASSVSWLGDGLLAVGPEIVSVRTWRARSLGAGVHAIVRAGPDLAAYGAAGVAVYTRSGRLRYRVTASPTFGGVTALDGRLYVAPGTVVDIASGRVTTAAIGFDRLIAG